MSRSTSVRLSLVFMMVESETKYYRSAAAGGATLTPASVHLEGNHRFILIDALRQMSVSQRLVRGPTRDLRSRLALLTAAALRNFSFEPRKNRFEESILDQSQHSFPSARLRRF